MERYEKLQSRSDLRHVEVDVSHSFRQGWKI